MSQLWGLIYTLKQARRIKMRAVHIFSTDDIDGKFASSIAYEYFRRYREDVDKYFFHDIKNNTLDAKPHSDDCVVIINSGVVDHCLPHKVIELDKRLVVLLQFTKETIDLSSLCRTSCDLHI